MTTQDRFGDADAELQSLYSCQAIFFDIGFFQKRRIIDI